MLPFALKVIIALPWARVTSPFAKSPANPPVTRVAVLGGGFAGLTAARTLASHRAVEVLLIDQREYFEYTPGILRAWVEPQVHQRLVNPIRRLLRSKRASFQRVPPGFAASLEEQPSGQSTRPLKFVVRPSLEGADDEEEAASQVVEYDCDYAILATGGELSPVSDDRLLPDGTIKARRARLEEQVSAVMANATSALVVGGGLTGVELAAELAERLGPSRVTLAVGPTRAERGWYSGDPGAGLLPGFRDTCDQWLNVGKGGAVRHVRKWLKKKGVRVLERWAVPPPAGATLSNVTAAARPACARSWRDAGDGNRNEALTWEAAGAAADLPADVVFDCRGLRPNTRESYVRRARDGAERLGLSAGCVAPSGWLLVDEKFRLAEPSVRRSEGEGAALAPCFGGRVYCVGDAAEKDKQERTAANAHAEGEYAALDILRAVAEKPPLPPFVAPPRLCAISLGKRDGVVVLGRWVALRGLLASVAKALIQLYFVNFLPLPYWLMRRLPHRQPRRTMGYGGASPDDMQLGRSGSSALIRQQRSTKVMQRSF